MNRYLLPIVTVTCLGLVFLFFSITIDRKPIEDPQERPSTLFTDDSGARAVYLLAQRTLKSGAAEQSFTPLWQLAPLERSPDTVVVLSPWFPLSTEENDELVRRLEAGGQLILCSSEDWEVEGQAGFLNQLGLEFNVKNVEGRLLKTTDNYEVWTEIEPDWKSGAENRTVSKNNKHIVELEVGDGRVLFVPDDNFLSNRFLRDSDNGLWLVRKVEEWGDGQVLFDEFHQGLGEQEGLLPLLRRFFFSRWGLPFLQLTVAGVLYLLVTRRRLGRVVHEVAHKKSDPLLLVKARAGLFEAAKARSVAVDRMCHELSYQLKSNVGKPADLERLGETDERVAELVQIHRRATEGKATENDVLRAGQLLFTIRKEHYIGS